MLSERTEIDESGLVLDEETIRAKTLDAFGLLTNETTNIFQAPSYR